MAAEPTLEPTIAREEELDEIDEGEESDIYEIEGEEEGDTYGPEEDEDEDKDGDGDEGVGEGGPDNMTALLLGKHNGTVTTEGYDDEDADEDEDEEYHEDEEGSEENPIDLSTAVAGSKRGVDELGEGDAYGDDDDEEAEEQIVAKKARV